MFALGIDPGWASFGLGIIDRSGKVVHQWSSAPKTLGITGFLDRLTSELEPYPAQSLIMERYVGYEGVNSGSSEYILMLIGALVYYFESRQVPVTMVRAIDWKSTLCKILVTTKDFTNPSSTFDKKFSLAAAQLIAGQKFKSDHEADAICLAYLGYLNGKNQ